MDPGGREAVAVVPIAAVAAAADDNERPLPAADVSRGLSGAQVDAQRAADGYNETVQAEANPVGLFLRKFTGLTAYMLEVTIVVACLPWVRKYTVAYIIGVLLVTNAVLGFVQEVRARAAVRRLRARLEVRARVLRDGAWADAPSRDLVRGDVVRVRLGDVVPADLVIVQGQRTCCRCRARLAHP